MMKSGLSVFVYFMYLDIGYFILSVICYTTLYYTMLHYIVYMSLHSILRRA